MKIAKDDVMGSLNLLNISDDKKYSDAPIVSSYNDQIRPLLDTVDRLRNLRIMQEGIQLPTIVVVGDQSSGKSSVLESLAGISLPRGQGICTRVPLIMRLQNHPEPEPELFLEFGENVVATNEERVADAIVLATNEIAGKGKEISNTPLTLIVKKNGVPDLTMVDLPGITRVPVHGQPENIYEQISEIIMEFINPDESIILNVLSSSVDFSTCESIRMSQRVDKTGERTLAVVTKADKSPEGLLEKVMADDVNIGLGYVCVRNRIGEETYEEARKEEYKLFETHPQLKSINKSMVGIAVLAERLVKIQATIIAKCLPDIVRKINDKLSSNVDEFNKLPKHVGSVTEAMKAVLQVLGSSKDSLRKILLQGEFDEYPEDLQMHCTARLAEMLNQYSSQLQLRDNGKFLESELKLLQEGKMIGLPNFLPRSIFLASLQRKVKEISMLPFDFVEKVWNYVENVVICIIVKHSENYPQLLSSMRRAAKNLLAKKKQESMDWVKDAVEMEKHSDYTCNPEYLSSFNKLMSYQTSFKSYINSTGPSYNSLSIDVLGRVDLSHLKTHRDEAVLEQAFDLKMRMTAYWNVVLRRMVDCMALHLMFSVRNMVNKEIEGEIIEELMGVGKSSGLERILEESPSVSDKRRKLEKSINLLKESKDAVANIMDKVVANAD